MDLRGMLLVSLFDRPVFGKLWSLCGPMVGPPTTESWKQFHFESGLKKKRIVENGLLKNRRAESAATKYGDGRTQCVHVSAPK